jgi:O-succinylbenzoic acid--CoA ligase
VISGGVKVPSPAVARLLRTHPAVTDAAVVGVPDEEWGERVVAVLVSAEPPPLADLRSLVTPRSWAPRQVVVVDAFPLLTNGKPDRLALRRLASGG